ncbi:cytochrome P450, partial [Mycena leptocephala]
MQPFNTLSILGCGLMAAMVIFCISRRRPKNPVPSLLRSNDLFSYYKSAFKFFMHAEDMIQKGCDRYPNSVFRVPRLFRWDYVAGGPKLTAEIIAAPDDVLSFEDGAEEFLQFEWTGEPGIGSNPNFLSSLRSGLTRNIGRYLPDLHDEVVCALDDVLGLQGIDWKEITLLPNMSQVIARTTARVFVGLPLCKDKRYVDLSISYTESVMVFAQIIAMVPNILPIFGRLLSPRGRCMRLAMKIVGPTIENRLAKKADLEQDQLHKPNDLISWLLNNAEGPKRTASDIALRLLVANTGAIHPTSTTITTALYDLTTHAEYILPLREEAERVIKAEGWTKSAIANMHKIDSFLRESQRMNAASPVIGMTRKVVAKNGFTFSDGTVILHGSFLNVASQEPAFNPVNYDNPKVFDGFRFVRERERIAQGKNVGIFKHHMVSTGLDYLVFGHGKYACPGRHFDVILPWGNLYCGFFAVAEVKVMMGHILINYDVKAQIEGVRPINFPFGIFVLPNPKGKIWIRRR